MAPPDCEPGGGVRARVRERGPNALGDHATGAAHPPAAQRSGGNREFVWSADGTLELQYVWQDGSGAVLARVRDELIFAWVLRRGRGMLSRVLVTDVVEMWEKMTVVRIMPFLGGALCGLHYLVLLIIRVRAAVWDSHTVAMAIIVLCTTIGSYCIYFYPSMRAATRRRSVVLLSFMYHIMPCISLVINAQVRVPIQPVIPVRPARERAGVACSLPSPLQCQEFCVCRSGFALVGTSRGRDACLRWCTRTMPMCATGANAWKREEHVSMCAPQARACKGGAAVLV